ncbi:hypothetical protein [Burkholderia cepacia]|uniref:Uncharacterized protein n=1 Tax=Burkholderia cepacia TaxID=292 RepID=A0AAX2RJV3_BURCE|nr:hypothetical protein [Burkholderia cepacia]TES99584.1 hypothetical protein E3D36_24140 [Burkholderia cepacia]TEU41577.1 hypothetical protein E3D37_26525 [Burkholderia cepacia]TEU48796.1 hypothetical protein E3D38_21610 [Burkholderia cepacia]TEU95318.1 hypothetical protein E3D40_24615 [Burkholderia cepacia]TEV04712.1 hypothetical protein E3D44_26140 [Burkholderia cepacia]
MSQNVMKVKLDWLNKAIFETSANPKGCFKQAWTMKLAREHGRCQLPRGFIRGRRFFVGGGAVPSRNNT